MSFPSSSRNKQDQRQRRATTQSNHRNRENLSTQNQPPNQAHNHSPSQAPSQLNTSRVLILSLVSAVLLTLAFPPFRLYLLAWVAPLGWLTLAHSKGSLGSRGYAAIWLSGCLFWLVQLHSIRLAFWVLYAGWVALSMYLAIYIALWIAATRVLHHQWRLPFSLAAAIAWTGCELIRAWFLTGYAANTLAHSQAWQPIIVQAADLLGHGGIGWVMMLFAALLWEAISSWGNTQLKTGSHVARWAAILCLPALLVGYGFWRIAQADNDPSKTAMIKCLLLQENVPSIFDMNPNADEYYDRLRTAWNSYANLSRSAAKQVDSIDLVVWPESMFTAMEPLTNVDFPLDQPLPEWLLEWLRFNGLEARDLQAYLDRVNLYFNTKLKIALLAARGMEADANVQLTDSPGPDLLVGCDMQTYATQRMQRYAGAVWVDSSGQVRDTYAKMHLVMFGEYIPLKPLLGWLEKVFGFAGADAGQQPKTFEIRGVKVAPNICFETMVPRLIVWQVATLGRQGQSPDLLINLTNDSWFKGTSMLDHHLASTILCSIENRRPILVAANSGLTAHVDGCGRLIDCSQRLTAEAIVAQPYRDSRWSLVQSAGYPLSWSCALITLLAWLSGLRAWRQIRLQLKRSI